MTDTNEQRMAGTADLSRVHERYGKPDLLAGIVGMLAGVGALVFLMALFAAGRASITPQINMINADGGLDEASIVGLLVAVAVVFAAFFVGGFAAGRAARYGGGMAGFGAGLWMILLVTVFAALGAWIGTEYNAFGVGELPNWVSQIDVEDVTPMAIIASMVLAAATLLGGWLGGRVGELYHRRADAAIVQETRKEV